MNILQKPCQNKKVITKNQPIDFIINNFFTHFLMILIGAKNQRDTHHIGAYKVNLRS